MSAIVTNAKILGGIPVFKGTRVPLRNLFDYLVHGDSIQIFLDDFPSVSFEQVRQVLLKAEVDLVEKTA